MDIITQGIAGAVLAQCGAGALARVDKPDKPDNPAKPAVGAATVAGFAAGVLPDADVLIPSGDDPLLGLELHRQFTHALVFIPLGGLVAALLLWSFMRGRASPGALYLFCLLGYSAGGLLDACTGFGTELLWPFSDERVAWNLVSVVDPVLTLALAVLLVLGLLKKKTVFPVMAVAFAGAYLALAYAQQQAATAAQWRLAQGRGHVIEQSIVRPTLGNIVLWRGVYLHGGRYYVDAIRVGPSAIKTFPGGAIAQYKVSPKTRDLAALQRQPRDIVRFERLTDGYLVRHPRDSNVIGDIRYAMLPDSIEPLWGIRLRPGDARGHVGESIYRKTDAATRRRFFAMLFGT